jgi:hypothetical protein
LCTIWWRERVYPYLYVSTANYYCVTDSEFFTWKMITLSCNIFVFRGSKMFAILNCSGLFDSNKTNNYRIHTNTLYWVFHFYVTRVCNGPICIYYGLHVNALSVDKADRSRIIIIIISCQPESYLLKLSAA